MLTSTPSISHLPEVVAEIELKVFGKEPLSVPYSWCKKHKHGFQQIKQVFCFYHLQHHDHEGFMDEVGLRLIACITNNIIAVTNSKTLSATMTKNEVTLNK